MPTPAAIGALGQVVGVAHAVDVHVGIAARQLVVGRGDVLPRGEDAAGTAHGQGRAQHVGVRLEAVHEAVGTELVAEGRAGGQVLADEPAVGGAAVGGGQLHDFQVIRHAQRVLARRGVLVDRGAAVRAVQLVVRQRDVQRALHPVWSAVVSSALNE
ncbi:hypothetical protein G6F68_015972 [Rhizopus microsporus]|nr:hypothetical protein G6F68_015972 [Rhizopus microsporus]